MYIGPIKPLKESWAFSLTLPRHTMEIPIPYSFIPSDESRINLSNSFKCSNIICPQLPILDPAGPSSVDFPTAALTSFLRSSSITAASPRFSHRFCSLLLNVSGIKTPSEEDPPLPFSHTFSFLWLAPPKLVSDTSSAGSTLCGIIRM